MTENPVIEIDHVTKIFGDYLAVDEANFSINKGEFFSMLGPSGCGKTTTLRMIAGFDTPTQGSIKLAGKDVSQVPPYKRNVNTVFQNYALFPHMTVLKNVMFGLKIKGVKSSEAQSRAKEMLEIVKLSDYADRKPAQLSGGQQQRVALARSLVNMPEALLLDEPLAALDLKLRQAMQFELKRIQREVGITFIFVTHDQHEALTMSDRIAVMSQGKVEHIGTPVEIYEQPATRFVASFIGDANLIEGKINEVNSNSVVVEIGDEKLVSSSLGDTFNVGDKTTVMIRPERILLTTSDKSKPENSITCTVISHTFQGAQSRYEMKTIDGQSIFAYVDWTDELPPQPTGANVYVSCNSNSIRTFLNK